MKVWESIRHQLRTLVMESKSETVQDKAEFVMLDGLKTVMHRMKKLSFDQDKDSVRRQHETASILQKCEKAEAAVHLIFDSSRVRRKKSTSVPTTAGGHLENEQDVEKSASESDSPALVTPASIPVEKQKQEEERDKLKILYFKQGQIEEAVQTMKAEKIALALEITEAQSRLHQLQIAVGETRQQHALYTEALNRLQLDSRKLQAATKVMRSMRSQAHYLGIFESVKRAIQESTEDANDGNE